MKSRRLSAISYQLRTGGFFNSGSDLCRVAYHSDTGSLQGGDLLSCGSSPAGDDCPGMAHASLVRSREPGDVGDDRFGHMTLNECCRLLLSTTPDLTDHQNASVAASFSKSVRQSTKLVPIIGS